MKKADVCIIGGGTIGSSVAYYLSMRKLRVLLLERKSIGSGSARANFGLITAQLYKYFKSFSDDYFQLKKLSVEMYSHLEEELEAIIEYKKTGGLVVIQNEKELEEKILLVDKLSKKGLEIYLLDKKNTLELEPALGKDILGASYCPVEGEVNPLLMTDAFVKAGKRNGLEIMTENPVLGFNVEGNRIASIQTHSGNIFADYIVNASGAWAAEIAKMGGIDIPLSLQRGQLIVTEAISPVLNRAVQHIPVAEADELNRNIVLSEEIRQMKSGNMIIGGTREYDNLSLDTTYEGITSIARRATNLLPCIRKVNIIRTFSGIRNIPTDGLPVLGSVSGLKGWVNAVCHAGIGLAPAVGKITADFIVDGKASINLESFNLNRFKM